MAFQIILIDLNEKLQATKIHNNANDEYACWWWWRCCCCCCLMLNLQNFSKRNFQERTKHWKRTNPICLMNHFSVFNTNYGLSFSCALFKHVCTCMRVRIFVTVDYFNCSLYSQNNLRGRETKKTKHATVLYTLCVLRESHFIFFCTVSNGNERA